MILCPIKDQSKVFNVVYYSFLGIEDESAFEEEDEEDNTNLTDSQKEKIEFANKLKAMGISEEDLEDFQEFKRQKEARKRAEELQSVIGEEPEQPSVTGEYTSVLTH